MNRARITIFALIVIISAAVYGITLCPTVELIDSGELALAAKNLGIAHPTGYPLYTLLSRIFSMLPIRDLIFRVNLLSLLFTAFGTGFLYLLISELLVSERKNMLKEAIAAAVALFAGFSPVWWAQGTTNEVYSFNLLLISISLWCLFRFVRQGATRRLIASAYLLGLSLANHLSAVYLIPGVLYIVIAHLWRLRAKRATILAAIFFIFPASLYMMLPIRAGFKPFLNWGEVNDPYFFYKHITGWQYRVWMFTKPFEIFNNFSAKISPAARLFLEQFGWIGVVLVLIGIIIGVVRNRRLLIFAGLIWIINLIYVLNYEIGDIESYYLPMFLISAIFMAIGVLYISELILMKTGRSKIIFWALVVSIFILPIYNLSANFHEQNRSGKTAARQGVYDLATATEPGGVILVENWDFYSPWLYLHFEENYRPDMVFLDKELMRRSWYIDFIRRYFGEIYQRSKPEFEEFLRQVAPFERNRPYNPQEIDRAYYAMLQGVIRHEMTLRPVYTNVLDDPKLMNGLKPIPSGLLVKFSSNDTFLDAPRAKFDESYWKKQSEFDPKRIGYLLSFYSRCFEMRSKYCTYYQISDEAEYYGNLSNRVKGVMTP
jgi:hypothetical protein